MTETVKIEVQADVTNAQQGMASLRDDLKKTKKEGDAVGTSFGEISRGLGSISPQLGRVSQSIGRLTDQMKKLGVQTGSNGAFGRMTSGLGKLTSSSGFRKGVGILGLGLAAGGILSSLMGGAGNNKLAGFDQLNAMGQETMMDFLSRQFKNLKTDSLKPIAEATTVTAENTTKLLDLYRQANPDLAGNTATDPQNIPEQIIDIEESGQTERTDITKKGWMDITDKFGNFLSNFDTMMGWMLVPQGGQTSKLSDSISYTGDNNITQKLVNDLKDKVDNGTTASKSLLEKLGDAIGGTVSTISDFASNAISTLTSVFDLSSTTATKSTISTSSSNPLVKWASHLANKSVNGGLLNESLFGSIIGMGGGASAGASATAKGASLLSKVGRLLGIPGFAEGGLFMPNQPQLAILGDNKSEMEVAAPKSMIVDGVREAMASTSGSATTMNDRASQPIPITLELDGKTLARILYDPMSNETIRRNGGVR